MYKRQVKTNSSGEIQIDNLMPGVYTVTEMDYDKYEPQEFRRVTVVSGQVSTCLLYTSLKGGQKNFFEKIQIWFVQIEKNFPVG